MTTKFTVEERAYLLMQVGSTIRVNRHTDEQRRKDDRPPLYTNRLEFLHTLMAKVALLEVTDDAPVV